MNLRQAAQQALEVLKNLQGGCTDSGDGTVEAITVWCPEVIEGLEQALAEPEQEPVAFDHSIGAERFKVVRGAYWWHILIGDSTRKYGKFHTRAGAEEMAHLLLREFRNGAFVQHGTAPTPRKPQTTHWEGCEAVHPECRKPEQEPVAWCTPDGERCVTEKTMSNARSDGGAMLSSLSAFSVPAYTAPTPRKPLTDEEIWKCLPPDPDELAFARAIERAHGIGEQT